MEIIFKKILFLSIPLISLYLFLMILVFTNNVDASFVNSQPKQNYIATEPLLVNPLNK